MKISFYQTSRQRVNHHRERLRKLSEPLTAASQPPSTRLIKPNFCFHLSHRRSTTVSLETRNPTFINDPEKIAHAQLQFSRDAIA